MPWKLFYLLIALFGGVAGYQQWIPFLVSGPADQMNLDGTARFLDVG